MTFLDRRTQLPTISSMPSALEDMEATEKGKPAVSNEVNGNTPWILPKRFEQIT